MSGRENKDKVIHKELSYRVVGILFEVYNEVGPGYNEKHYERAIRKLFELNKIKFKAQVSYILKFRGSVIGRYYLDFLVENKIILEIKKGNYFSKRNIHQVNEYLRATGLQLAILANFTLTGVKFMRLLNVV